MAWFAQNTLQSGLINIKQWGENLANLLAIIVRNALRFVDTNAQDEIVVFAHHFNVEQIITARFDNLRDLGVKFGVNHCKIPLVILPTP